ncbi:hypothetical protein D3C76_1648790 [compost metagenome]
MVRQHLMFCRHCRRFLKQMRMAQATVRALPEEPVVDSDALAERLARELKNS